MSASRLKLLLDREENKVVADPLLSSMGACVRDDFEDDYHLTYLSGDFELMFDRWSNRLKAIYLRPRAEEYAKINGLVPFELTFNFSRIAVRQKFGSPDKECRPGAKTILGPVPPWDTYVKDGLKVNIQYSLDEKSIAQVTVMSGKLAAQ